MAVTIQEAVDIVGDFATKLPALALSQLGETVGAIKDDMTEEGSPVTYPIIWDSPRQQAAFFATDGFGKGIPTGRSGQHVGGWLQSSITDGWALSNPSPAAAISGFYAGEQWQSSIHSGRWLHIATSVAEHLALLPGQLMAKVSALWNESIHK